MAEIQRAAAGGAPEAASAAASAQALADFIRRQFRRDGPVTLNEPSFEVHDEAALKNVLASTFVSTAGPLTQAFEKRIAEFCGARHAIACNTGTAALHTCLDGFGVRPGDLVITQSFSFVATANVVRYCGADPVFLDIEREGLGLDPACLTRFLEERCTQSGGETRHRDSGRRVSACIPMHTYGHTCDMAAIRAICSEWGLAVIEDAAEAMGSTLDGVPAGMLGDVGVFSFNGNKIITTGGGGVIMLNDDERAERLLHRSSTARRLDAFDSVHDEVAFNYRMPSLNAALGLSQLEKLPRLLEARAELAATYEAYLENTPMHFYAPVRGTSNYWLNAVLCPDRAFRDAVLSSLNAQGIHARGGFVPIHSFPMYSDSLRDDLSVTEDLAVRLVTLPSSPVDLF